MVDYGATIDAAIRGEARDPNSDEAKTCQLVLASLAELQQEFRDRDRLYEDIEKVIFLENAVTIPKNYKKSTIEVRSPIANHITNSITAALSINHPKVHFDPIGIGDSYDENATLRERFFDNSWQRQEEEANRRLFRLWMHALVTKGEAVMKTVERTKRAWSGYSKYSKDIKAEYDTLNIPQSEKDRAYDVRTEEYKRGAPYPIASTDVPPETFYYTKNEDGFTSCIESKQIPYYDALCRYDQALNTKGEIVPAAMGLPRNEWHTLMGKTTMLQMVEYWDWERCIYILQGPADIAKKGSGKIGSGAIVKTLKHRYGDRQLKVLRGPYFHALGITTSSREIYKQGLGVLFAYLRLFPLLDSLLTIQSQAAFMYGFPAFKRTTPQAFNVSDAQSPYGTDASEATQNREPLTPGAIIPYDIAPVEMPRGGIDLDKTIAMVRGMLELALPSAAQGLTGGGDSGYLLNQAAHLAQLAWQPIVDNAEFAQAQRTGFESYLIENCIRERVYVYGRHPGLTAGSGNRKDKGWLGVGPKDLNGIHRYTVKIEAATPSNKTLRIRDHQAMLGLHLETEDQAITDMGNNPIEVKRAWMLKKIIDSPEVQKQLMQRVFRGLATIDQQAMLESGTEAPGAAPMAPQQAQMPQPQQPVQPQLNPAPIPPGTVPGQPGGVRNIPQGATPIPGRQ